MLLGYVLLIKRQMFTFFNLESFQLIKCVPLYQKLPLEPVTKQTVFFGVLIG